MGRRKRQGNFTLQKTNNLVGSLVGNEENEYSVPDPNRVMINMTNELKNFHKKISQRGIHE
jgi:hypothetical protein